MYIYYLQLIIFFALMPEWSKGYDSSSYGESLVGSNLQCIYIFYSYYEYIILIKYI